MTSPRKVNNRDPMRHRVLAYLHAHPQEMQYIIGDFLADHPEARERIAKQWEKDKNKDIKTKTEGD